jgi:prepilin-type processing-associated H-X9-DG protein
MVREQWKKAAARKVLIVLGAIGLLFMLCWPVGSMLLLGWAGFLARVLPRLSPDMPTVVATLVALALFTCGVHWLGRKTSGTSPAARWTWRRSVALTALVFVLFAAGVAMVGLAHMSYWLATSPEPIRVTVSWNAPFRAKSQNNLTQQGLAILNYEAREKSLPAAGTFSDDGRALHGWETQLLPFLEEENLYRKIDLRQPWDAAANAPHFKHDIAILRHPIFDELTDERGFGLIHYAANGRVLRAGVPTRLGDITDGVDNTILLGEINSRFPPWGQPMNVRDPGLGINRSPRGFGGPPRAGGANFLFVDGHVVFLSDNVSPDVLRALATPAGGERIDLDELDR